MDNGEWETDVMEDMPIKPIRTRNRGGGLGIEDLGGVLAGGGGGGGSTTAQGSAKEAEAEDI